MDDEAWLARLRQAVADGVDRTYPDDPAAVRPAGDRDRDLAAVPGELEHRLLAVEARLRRMEEDRDRLVADIADAVVARLDARWRGLSG
ncbi:MAG: hypothetical protein ACLGIC_11975 [Acidimicrobiia bacterium]